MSRYTLLLLLNLPFILAGILSAVTSYKIGKMQRKRMIVQVLVWIIVLCSLAAAEPIYTWLFSNNLTQTEPLSLFDVVQITAIDIVFYMANRLRLKTERLERRVQDLHQELSIILSEQK